MDKSSKPEILHVHPAGPDHQVLIVRNTGEAYCKRPCQECPWRTDMVGGFPPEAFIVSAPIAYDVPDTMIRWINDKIEPSTFSCHMAGTVKPATCAGFLLRGALHNLSVRLKGIRGRQLRNVSAGDVKLHDSYRAMAVANGVDPADPALAMCRDDAHATYRKSAKTQR